MSDLWRRTWAILWKDLLIELRTKQGLNAMVFFAGLVLLLFSFAIGPNPELLRQLAGGLLWVAIVFTGTVSLGRSFQSEELAGGLQLMRLYPGERRAIFLGKLMANLVLLLAVEVVLFPAAGVLFQINMWPHAWGLAGIAVIGSFGFSTVGTFYAALTVHLRARELMLPLLVFLALIPLLLAAVNATGGLILGDAMGQVSGWLRLLVAYDVILFVVCVWIFPVVLEE